MKAALLAALVCSASAQTVDVHVGQRGAFAAGPGGSGIISGVVDLRTTVQFPEGGNTVMIGGRSNGTGSSTYQSPGRTSESFQGGGGYSTITVTPVPVITGPEEHALTGVAGRELLSLLGSGDASDRLSAAAEIGRRPWSPKARRVLTRNLATRLGDEAPRVVAASAHALAQLADPEATALIVPYLRGRDPARLVPMIEALAQLGDVRSRAPLQKLADHIDLDISLAASRGLTTLERRAATLPAAPAGSPAATAPLKP